MIRKLARVIKYNPYVRPFLFRPTTWLYEHVHPSKVKIGDNIIYLDKKDTLRLWLNKEWEPTTTNLLKEHIRTFDTCVDVGAHIGYHTLTMAQSAAIVMAIEPDPDNFSLLNKNVIVNGFWNKVVRLEAAVASPYQGKITLYKSSISTGGHTLTESFDHRVPIRVAAVALSDLFIHDWPIEIDVLKIDVEGWEMNVLRSLRGMRPRVIFIEAFEKVQLEAGYSIFMLWDWLKHDYIIFRIIEDLGSCVEMKEPQVFERNYNWFCFRKDEAGWTKKDSQLDEYIKTGGK